MYSLGCKHGYASLSRFSSSKLCRDSQVPNYSIKYLVKLARILVHLFLIHRQFVVCFKTPSSFLCHDS